MTLATQIALTATPLSTYLYALAILHGGRRPRVVSGRVDYGLLAFGISGLIAFGPAGQGIMSRCFGPFAVPWQWAAWVGLVATWLVAFAGPANRRLAIYKVAPEELESAVREALDNLGGDFSRTMAGYEDAARRTGIRLSTSRWFQAGSVEGFGEAPEALVAELTPHIRTALDRIVRGPRWVSHALFVLSGLVMLVPVSGYFLVTPRAQEALRNLMQSLRFW